MNVVWLASLFSWRRLGLHFPGGKSSGGLFIDAIHICDVRRADARVHHKPLLYSTRWWRYGHWRPKDFLQGVCLVTFEFIGATVNLSIYLSISISTRRP